MIDGWGMEEKGLTEWRLGVERIGMLIRMNEMV